MLLRHPTTTFSHPIFFYPSLPPLSSFFYVTSLCLKSKTFFSTFYMFISCFISISIYSILPYFFVLFYDSLILKIKSFGAN